MSALLLTFEFLNTSWAKSGLLCGGLALVLVLLSLDRQSPTVHGFVVGKNWFRQACLGFAAGFVVYAGYCLCACLAGAVYLQPAELTPYRSLKGFLGMISAIPVAAVQQVIFCGYLQGRLRTLLGRAVAILLTSLLFATLACLGRDYQYLFSLETGYLVVSLFLVSVLLGILRFQTGNIVLGTSVLAGAIAVRRFTRKSDLLGYDHASDWYGAFSTGQDLRQGYMFWCLLIPFIVIALVLLRRWGEPPPATNQAGLSTSFKRLFPFSNLMALAPLDLWFAALVDARFRVEIKYLPRLFWILTISSFNTLLTLPERLLGPLVLRHRVPDPVFIVGLHRSGTTYLHNLLALDPRFCTPRNYQIVNPFGALFSGWLLFPFLGMFLTVKRPMDGMRFNVFSPQEEEFAIAGMTRCSPYWGFNFPRRFASYEQHVFLADETSGNRERWVNAFLLFLKKITFLSRKTPLLKSPYNTARVKLLSGLFPQAKFVHIHRHPYDVFRSNRHFAREGIVAFQVQDPDPQEGYETRFLENQKRQLQAYYRESAELPEQNRVEVKFENLEADPIEEVRRFYGQLGWEMSTEFEIRLKKYIGTIHDYRKNQFVSLSPLEQSQIDFHMGEFARRWDYDTPTQFTEQTNQAA